MRMKLKRCWTNKLLSAIHYTHIIKSKGLPVLIVLCIYSCAQTQEENAGVIVASVENKNLYKSDLHGLVGKEVSKTDSANIISNYINAWVRKQVMLAKAQKEVKLDEAEIERKIADYRYDLTIYAFEKQY